MYIHVHVSLTCVLHTQQARTRATESSYRSPAIINDKRSFPVVIVGLQNKPRPIGQIEAIGGNNYIA